MMLTTIILLGFLFDNLFGDPLWLWHPVRAIGCLISHAEKCLRRIFPSTPKGEFLAGIFLWLITCGISFAVPFALLYAAEKINIRLRFFIETLMCYQIFACKSLADAGKHIRSALSVSLDEGRKAVSRYVGRDTAELSCEGVIKAAIETVAENLTDGIIAPLFFLLLGGAPLGFFYKAVNTLDSMVGYRNERFEYLGKCSARIDDILGFIPARLAAGCMLLSAGILKLRFTDAWRIFRRDRMRTKSPNAGQTESVCAGALGVQLGGDASYFGAIVKKPTLGDDIRKVEIQDIASTCRLMRLSSILAVFGGCLIRWFYVCGNL